MKSSAVFLAIALSGLWSFSAEAQLIALRDGVFTALSASGQAGPDILFAAGDRERVRWAPDGSSAVYGPAPVFAIGADGGNQRLLTDALFSSWTWDARHILAIRDRKEVIKVEVRTGAETSLYEAPEGSPRIRDAALAPDGVTMVVQVESVRDCPICIGPALLMDVGGGNRREIMPDANLQIYQPFSRDGRRVMVTINGEQEYEFLVFDVETLDLVGRARDATGALWAPQGHDVAFKRDGGCCLRRRGVYVLTAGGQEVELVDLSEGLFDGPPPWPGDPHWSPTEDKIAYTLFRQGRSGEPLTPLIFTVRPDGQDLAELAEGHVVAWAGEAVPRPTPVLGEIPWGALKKATRSGSHK